MSKTLLDHREQSASSLSSRELSDLVWKFNNLNSTAKMLLLGTNSQSVPFIPISELSESQSNTQARTQPSQPNTSLSSLSNPGSYILSQRDQDAIINDQHKWSSLEQAWTHESLRTNQANLFEPNTENSSEHQSQLNAAQIAALSNTPLSPPISRRQAASPSLINIQPVRTPYQAEQELEEQNAQLGHQAGTHYSEQRSTEEQRRLTPTGDYIASNKVGTWTQYSGYDQDQKNTPLFIKKTSNVGKSLALISLITAMGLGAFYFLPKMFTNRQDLNKNQQDEENLDNNNFGKDLDSKSSDPEDSLTSPNPDNALVGSDTPRTETERDKALDKTYFQEDGKTAFKPMGLPLPSKTISSTKNSFYKSDYKSNWANSSRTQSTKNQFSKANSQKTASKNLQEYYMPKWVVMDEPSSSAMNSTVFNDALASKTGEQDWNSYSQILPKPSVDTATTYDSSLGEVIKPLAYTAQYFPIELSYVKNNGQFQASFTPNNSSSFTSNSSNDSQDSDLTAGEDQEYSEEGESQVKQSPYANNQTNNQVQYDQKDKDLEIENLLAKPSFYKTTSAVDTLPSVEKAVSNNVEREEYAPDRDDEGAQAESFESAPVLRKPIQSSSSQISDDVSGQILPSPYKNNGVSLTTSMPGNSQTVKNPTKVSSSQFDSSSAVNSNNSPSTSQSNSKLSSIKQKFLGRGKYANQYKQEAVAKNADQSLNQYQTDLNNLQKRANNPENLSEQEKVQLVRDIEALKRKVSQTGQEIEEVAHTVLPPEMASSKNNTSTAPKVNTTSTANASTYTNTANNLSKEDMNQLENDAAQVYSRPPFENTNGNSSLNIGYL